MTSGGTVGDNVVDNQGGDVTLKGVKKGVMVVEMPAIGNSWLDGKHKMRSARWKKAVTNLVIMKIYLILKNLHGIASLYSNCRPFIVQRPTVQNTIRLVSDKVSAVHGVVLCLTTMMLGKPGTIKPDFAAIKNGNCSPKA